MTNSFLTDPLYPQIDYKKYTQVTTLLRNFFIKHKGFHEVHPQNRLAILSACENPHSIAKFSFDAKDWPLPQTGQMTLEDYLLLHPEETGFVCVTTSYRNEKNPEPGRHHKIFPMFEFETHGTIEDLKKLEIELLTYLGFQNIQEGDYELTANAYGVKEIDSKTEAKISEDISNVFLLTQFPEHTNPFWNMKRGEDRKANKIDVILHGQETIGSAERSCDVDQMRTVFFTIENGKYAEKLFDLFGYSRVIDELNIFLTHKFIPRVGGGIGLTRLVRAMELSNLI
jgi:aspartyl/asparaginyl-tRNA synthetase